MTSNEIKAVIERLGAYCNSTYDVMLAFMNYGNSADYGCTEFKGVLLELLKQADPDTHMELPKDMDGVPIHIGDVLYEEGSEPFEVDDMMTSRTNGWELYGDCGEGFSAYNPATCRHYHKPTIESAIRSVLTEYAEIVRNVRDSDVESVVNECASKIKELNQHED